MVRLLARVAMPRALQMMTLANGGPARADLHAPRDFASRAVKAQDGRLMPMEDIPSQHVLGKAWTKKGTWPGTGGCNVSRRG